MTVITINQRGQIDAMTINPVPAVAEGRFAGYTDKTQMKLPFNDEWLVYQGGRNVFDNGYAMNDDQRFSMDFVYLKRRPAVLRQGRHQQQGPGLLLLSGSRSSLPLTAK